MNLNTVYEFLELARVDYNCYCDMLTKVLLLHNKGKNKALFG